LGKLLERIGELKQLKQLKQAAADGALRIFNADDQLLVQWLVLEGEVEDDPGL